MPDPVQSSARACARFNCAPSYPCSWSITGLFHVAGIGAMIHITAQMPVLVAIRVGQWKEICAPHEYRLYRVEELTVSCKKSKRDRSFSPEHCFPFVFGAGAFTSFATVPLQVFRGIAICRVDRPFLQSRSRAFKAWAGQYGRGSSSQPNAVN